MTCDNTHYISMQTINIHGDTYCSTNHINTSYRYRRHLGNSFPLPGTMAKSVSNPDETLAGTADPRLAV